MDNKTAEVLSDHSYNIVEYWHNNILRLVVAGSHNLPRMA